MKSLLLVCAILIVVEVTYGAVSIIPADPSSDHPGHCNSDITGPLKHGEAKTIEECVRATCNNDGSIQLATCGAISTPCGLGAPDLTKEYPDCCPQPKDC